MTKAKRSTTDEVDRTSTMSAPAREGETEGQAVARIMLQPEVRHGYAVSKVTSAKLNSEDPDAQVNLDDFSVAVAELADAAKDGDLAFASRTLAAQAVTLDTLFTEMARRAAVNMDQYLEASERYARMALKAQAQSRATLEALAKLHQPRVQTVRHIHINEGGQAIVADQFNTYPGGYRNEGSAEQPHGPTAGAAGERAALPRPNEIGNSMPVPRDTGKEKVPPSRMRQRKRRTKGKS